MADGLGTSGGSVSELGWSAVDVAFRLYLATLPFTATAIINVGTVGVPLSYGAFALFVAALAWNGTLVVRKVTTPDLALGLFLADLVGVSVLLISSHRVSEALRGAAYAKLATQTAYWLAVALQFWVTHAYLRSLSGEHLASLLRFAALAGIIVALYSIYQFLAFVYDLPLSDVFRNSASYSIVRGADLSGWVGMPRARAFAPEPSFWAAYLLVALGWVLAALRGTRRVFGMLVLLLSLTLSFSRSGWFGLVSLSIVLGATYGGRRERMMVSLTGLTLVAAVTAMTVLGFDVVRRLISFQDLSAVERFTTQLDALSLARAHPWLGLGWGFFDVLYGGVGHTAVTFDLYVSILVGAGVLGLGLFVFYLWTIAHAHKWRDARAVSRIGILFSLGAVAFSWLSIPGYNFSFMWVAMAFGAASAGGNRTGSLAVPILDRRRA
jgi:hypothetical protein